VLETETDYVIFALAFDIVSILYIIIKYLKV